MSTKKEYFYFFRLRSRPGQLCVERPRASAASGVQLERGTAGRGQRFKGIFGRHRCLRKDVAEAWRSVVPQVRFGHAEKSGTSDKVI